MRGSVPKVAAIHDLSCIGRCSLTVILPILSCMGIQVCPLPTAILSSHLGGFREVEFYDFTEHMPSFLRHWRQEHIGFECLYSGFLASERQIDVVLQMIEEFAADCPLVLVDPVMGDDGKLYSVYTSGMQDQMKKLISKADIITPNYTEACFLLDEPYRQTAPDVNVLETWAAALAARGPSCVVITGIPLADGRILNLGHDRRRAQFWQVANSQIPIRFPGTGDAFASVLIGSLLNRRSLPEAMQAAANFVAAGIELTAQAGTPVREGILLEKALPLLCRNDRQA